MKRIITSAGLVALSAASVQAAAPVPEFASVDGSKAWSVSATLRGFYDDNVSTLPDGDPRKEESFGFQVSPSLSLNLPVGQTALGLSYVYSLKYYEEKPAGNANNDDQTHTFNIGLERALSERFQIQVTDSFVVGQEPDSLRAGNAFSTFQRVPGDNIRNYGTITLNAQITRLFGVEVGYANALYDYDDDGATLIGTVYQGSLSGNLDRLEHLAHLDGRWQVFRETVGIVGYQYGQVDYTADEPIGGSNTDPVMSDYRNSRSHYAYVGAEHNFRADLSGAFRAGVRYIDFYDDPSDEDDVTPYVQASVSYRYSPDNFVRVGGSYDRNATDRGGVDVTDNSFTHDAQSLVAFASVNHRILPNLYGKVTGQLQNSTFNNGLFDNDTENYYLVGVNLEYRFHPNLSAEVGYNYDQTDSDLSGGDYDFTRNRVYLGVTASY